MYTVTNVYKYGNLELAYNRLITNPESTYKTYFRNTYNDFALSLDENIKNIRSEMKAGYLPKYTIRTFMPKSNGLSRMYTLLTIEDQIVYQAYANIIAEAICNKIVRGRYKKSVFGNLYTDKENQFFYQPWRESYIAYTRAIVQAYNSGLKYIASFDLTACYDSINHSLIKNLMMKNHFSENCANEFVRLLGKWESENGPELGTGIPQGPQASGIVAEMVLTEYDEYIENLQKKYKFKYFRYVDDIRVLADNEKTVQWVLFLLDKKSKELGLFPQSSKIDVHKIDDINLEVKRISLPLFEDDFEEEEKQKIAIKNISILLKKNDVDLTLVKRYFHFVKHSSYANKVSIKLVRQCPNFIHSFAYYILRYPRKLPRSITDFIFEVCNDKSQQFAAGILLEVAINNMTNSDNQRFLKLAEKLIKEDAKTHFIVDCRFEVQLILLTIIYGNLSKYRYRKLLEKEYNWWEIKEIVPKISLYDDDLTKTFICKQLSNPNSDDALASARAVFEAPLEYELPAIASMSAVVQNTFKKAGIIQRSRYNNSQINKYIFEIIEKDLKFAWKKKLGKEHEHLERNIFSAMNYWKTDLTAFVNIWDTIDDRLCYEVTTAHSELGGYNLGNIGGIQNSIAFKNILPKFHKMAMEIHKLRLHSYLSHAVIRNTNYYTGPIKQKERKRISKLIQEGLEELISYW